MSPSGQKQQEIFEHALSLFSKQQYSTALKEFRKITQQSLQILKHYYIGLCFVQLGYFEKALESYKKIHEIPATVQGVEYDRIMYGLYINMGSVLQKLAKKHGMEYYREAKKCYTYALEIKSSDERVWNNLGNVYLEMEHYLEAIRCFNKALKLNPEFPAAYYCLSLVHEYQKKKKKAIEYLKKELQWKPRNKVILNRLAGLLFGTKHFDEALHYAQKVIEYYPHDLKALESLVLIHYNLDNIDQAVACYKKLQSFHPEFEPRETEAIFKDLKKLIENK